MKKMNYKNDCLTYTIDTYDDGAGMHLVKLLDEDTFCELFHLLFSLGIRVDGDEMYIYVREGHEKQDKKTFEKVIIELNKAIERIMDNE